MKWIVLIVFPSKPNAVPRPTCLRNTNRLGGGGAPGIDSSPARWLFDQRGGQSEAIRPGHVRRRGSDPKRAGGRRDLGRPPPPPPPPRPPAPRMPRGGENSQHSCVRRKAGSLVPVPAAATRRAGTRPARPRGRRDPAGRVGARFGQGRRCRRGEATLPGGGGTPGAAPGRRGPCCHPAGSVHRPSQRDTAPGRTEREVCILRLTAACSSLLPSPLSPPVRNILSREAPGSTKDPRTRVGVGRAASPVPRRMPRSARLSPARVTCSSAISSSWLRFCLSTTCSPPSCRIFRQQGSRLSLMSTF